MTQDVEKLFPELEYKGADNPAQNFYDLDNSGFGVLAIKAIQEQQTIIEQQQATIESLTTQILDINQKLNNILIESRQETTSG
jgi:hypothetical protein